MQVCEVLAELSNKFTHSLQGVCSEIWGLKSYILSIIHSHWEIQHGVIILVFKDERYELLD